MAESNWNEAVPSISIHCLGCGKQSPTQETPSPLCPECVEKPDFISYVKRYVEANKPKIRRRRKSKITSERPG